MNFRRIYEKLEDIIPKIKKENRKLLYDYALFVVTNVEGFVKENGTFLVDLGEFIELWRSLYPELSQKLDKIDDDDIRTIENFFYFMREEIHAEKYNDFTNNENDTKMDFNSFLEEVERVLSISIDKKTVESLRKYFDFAFDYLKENYFHGEEIDNGFKEAYPDDYERIGKLGEDVFLEIGCIIELNAMD